MQMALHKKLRRVRQLAAGIGLLVMLGVGYGGWKYLQFKHATPMSAYQTSKQYTYFDVHSGLGARRLAKELYEKHIVTSAFWFSVYLRFNGGFRSVRAADYRFSSDMTVHDVVRVLQSGISYGISVTVPEGHNIHQIAGLLDAVRPTLKQEWLELQSNSMALKGLAKQFGLPVLERGLEGYLFPDTYVIERKATAIDFARQMLRRHVAVVQSFLKNSADSGVWAGGLSNEKIIILASMVEKETGASFERPIIASVFHNRLKKKMRLQSDPTVIYGIKNYSGNITKQDLLTPSPYNTYTLPGLPYGPIANPGLDAVRAVVYPEVTRYLYFVSRNDGTHQFTENYQDHLQAVKSFQLDAAARAGKSWRDLRNSH